MQRELTGLDVLFLTALFDQPFGQLRAFAISDHPAGDVTAENIEEDIQVEVRSPIAFIPLILLLLLVVSYATRPATRRWQGKVMTV